MGERRLVGASTPGPSDRRWCAIVNAMSTRSGIVTVLEPEDEYPHEPDAAENYNESMYLNAFDAGA